MQVRYLCKIFNEPHRWILETELKKNYVALVLNFNASRDTDATAANLARGRARSSVPKPAASAVLAPAKPF